MKLEFVHKEGSDRLILIFAGWSTDASFYSDVVIPGWDTLVAYGYSDLDFDPEVLSPYPTVALFAWSMGVFAAARTLPFERLALAVAVNGTEHPADDLFGIPADVFRGTLRSLSPRNLLKFRKRMAGDSFASMKDRFAEADIESLRGELDFILSRQQSPAEAAKSRWDRVYIGSADLIFPPQSQRRAWELHPSRPEIVEADAPHLIPLPAIVKGALPACGKVGRRFLKALPTYDRQAAAQRAIASALAADIMRKAEAGELRNVVEIGPGSGLLTRAFAAAARPERMDFVELYPLPPFGVAPEENYVTADAETWIEEEAGRNPGSRDAVISASAMQWFADPRRFIDAAFRLLRPGGILACSTFLPGNLGELAGVNPFGLIYRSRRRIEEMIAPLFPSFSLREGEIPVEFGSAREAIIHLKHTGVGGASASELSMGEILRRVPARLTYRPLFITARKPSRL